MTKFDRLTPEILAGVASDIAYQFTSEAGASLASEELTRFQELLTSGGDDGEELGVFRRAVADLISEAEIEVGAGLFFLLGWYARGSVEAADELERLAK